MPTVLGLLVFWYEVYYHSMNNLKESFLTREKYRLALYVEEITNMRTRRVPEKN